SHNKGAFLLAASLLIVLLFAGPGWSSRLRALAAYAAGGAAVGLIFVCILLAQGALGAFLEDCVFFVLRNYSDIQSVPYGTLFGMFDHRSGPGIVAVEVLLTWPAAAPLVAAALELALVLRDRRGRRLTALLAVHGTVHLGAALHRPDFVHLHIVAMVPTALLLAHLHLLRGQPAAASDARRSLSACSAAALLGLAAVCVGGAWTIVADALRAPRHPVPSVGSGAWTSSPPLAETVEGVARLVKTRTAAGEPIFVFPHSSVYYLAADRPNATRFDVPLESPGREPMIDEIVRTLDREKVRYVVLDTWWTEAMVESLFPNLGISFMNGRFTAYLDRAYDVELRLPLAVVYRRKPG
ncbi:MAG TPA: hypothetical protein VEJ18_04690, partial [Planctomycetota bacterium]|nr:hypothetical protein [Planctomycetota bacterium]